MIDTIKLRIIDTNGELTSLWKKKITPKKHTECNIELRKYVTYLSYTKKVCEGLTITYSTYYERYNKRYLFVIVNPSKLLEKRIYIDSNKCEIDYLENLIFSQLKNIFSSNIQLNTCLSRIDYCLDVYFDKEERKQYIRLLNKGYKEYGYLKKKKTYPYGLKLKSKSVGINIYDKREERIGKGIIISDNNYEFEFIRLEVQVLRPRIRYQLNRYGICDNLGNYYSIADRDFYINTYLRPIIMLGDYYKIYHAKTILNKNYSEKMVIKLLEYFAYIGRHKLNKAKLKYGSVFYSYNKRLQSIGINPIPISKHEKINHLPNILDMAFKQNANGKIIDDTTKNNGYIDQRRGGFELKNK